MFTILLRLFIYGDWIAYHNSLIFINEKNAKKHLALIEGDPKTCFVLLWYFFGHGAEDNGPVQTTATRFFYLSMRKVMT